MRFIPLFLLLIVFSNLCEGYELGIAPAKVEIRTNVGEEICKSFILFSNDYSGRIKIEEDLDEKLIIKDENFVELNKSEHRTEICFYSSSIGNFNGSLTFSSDKANIEIRVPINLSVTNSKVRQNNLLTGLAVFEIKKEDLLLAQSIISTVPLLLLMLLLQKIK
jgi:hypothetical protein